MEKFYLKELYIIIFEINLKMVYNINMKGKINMENTNLEIERQVVTILNKVRPYLQRDGGDVEFVKVEDGIVYLKLVGACVGCASIDLTLRDGIETILLEEVPGIIGVENIE
jgi:Fe-S cluster biogenesis protein NfuA